MEAPWPRFDLGDKTWLTLPIAGGQRASLCPIIVMVCRENSVVHPMATLTGGFGTVVLFGRDVVGGGRQGDS